MKSTFAAIGAFLVLASNAAPAVAACGAVLGADPVLKPGVRLIVGEMHGSDRTPRTVGDLVCLAAQKGAVRLGLEIPSDQQPAINAFLASAGSPADRSLLLHGEFWTRDIQDGRSSVAMAELIDSVRKLRRAGADVDIVAFDIANDVPDRDLGMAENLLVAFAKAPKSIFIALAGNLHARRNSGRWKQTFMAARLLERGASVTTLDCRYGGGTIWACMPECGPTALGGGAGAPPAIVLGTTKEGAYDGVLDVGAPTFSPPAAVPITKEQQARASSTQRQLDAIAAYESKSYARCAELYRELARTNHSNEDAYNAASCFALAGNTDRAFEQLNVAIEFGFKDANGLRKDRDLSSLRLDARWKPLVARLQKQ